MKSSSYLRKDLNKGTRISRHICVCYANRAIVSAFLHLERVHNGYFVCVIYFGFSDALRTRYLRRVFRKDVPSVVLRGGRRCHGHQSIRAEVFARNHALITPIEELSLLMFHLRVVS